MRLAGFLVALTLLSACGNVAQSARPSPSSVPAQAVVLNQPAPPVHTATAVRPTARPTMQPTPVPTRPPTTQPTPVPTLVPTIAPTAVPAAVPVRLVINAIGMDRSL